MDNARVRIRNVRLKGNVTLLRQPKDVDREHIERSVRSVLDSQHDLAGFAIVVWGADFSTTCDMDSGPRSNIPSIVIPDLVRARLLAYRTETWTIQSLIPDYEAP